MKVFIDLLQSKNKNMIILQKNLFEEHNKLYFLCAWTVEKKKMCKQKKLASKFLSHVHLNRG